MNFWKNRFKNKDIVFELTRKQVKTQYRGSTFGFVWTVLNPLLNMLVMWAVFSNVLGIKDPYYPIYLLAGNIVFAALRSSTTQALGSMVENRNLLLRTKTDLSVFPLSNVLTSIVNFGFSLIALIPFMIWLSLQEGINLFSYQLPFILLMLPALLIFEYGLGLFLGVLFVFFRDLKHLYGVFLTLWQYMTPIFYPVARVKNTPFYTVVRLNPMYYFVNYFRDCVYAGATGYNMLDESFGASFIPPFQTLGIIYLCAAASLVLGYTMFYLLRSKIITNI